MSRVIVIEFVSLDGVMHDPDGSDGSAQGGWAFRYGREAVAGDKFGLGEVLDTGAMLLGRRTWQLFAKIWPGRDDPFSAKLNAMPKLVVSRSLDQAADWQNSAVLQGDLVTEVRQRKQEQDIVITGSASVVRTLMAHDLVDEYRPHRVPAGHRRGHARVPRRHRTGQPGPWQSARTTGPAVRLIYTRA
jgi:dihydrofolate reductase